EQAEHGAADRLVARERGLVEEADDAGGDQDGADDERVDARGRGGGHAGPSVAWVEHWWPVYGRGPQSEHPRHGRTRPAHAPASRSLRPGGRRRGILSAAA